MSTHQRCYKKSHRRSCRCTLLTKLAPKPMVMVSWIPTRWPCRWSIHKRKKKHHRQSTRTMETTTMESRAIWSLSRVLDLHWRKLRVNNECRTSSKRKTLSSFVALHHLVKRSVQWMIRPSSNMRMLMKMWRRTRRKRTFKHMRCSIAFQGFQGNHTRETPRNSWNHPLVRW